jgi:hypothetical protein
LPAKVQWAKRLSEGGAASQKFAAFFCLWRRTSILRPLCVYKRFRAISIQLLRSSTHKGGATWQQAADLARTYRGEDPDG